MVSSSDKSGAFISGSVMMPQEEMLEIKREKKTYKIGVLSDTSGIEHRIPLAPLAIEQLVSQGFEVYVEQGAGAGANFTDRQFAEYGANIITEKSEVAKCYIVLKVLPLDSEEIELLKGNQIIITSLHSNCQDKEYFTTLIKKKVTALAFDTMQDNHGVNPIMRSMSEIAGRSSILIASEYLSNVHRGKGEMLGGLTGVSPTEVIIVGAGTAGTYAAQTAVSLGALVKVFDNSISNLDNLQQKLGAKVYTSTIHSKVLTNALKSADVVIGALRIRDKRPKIIITEDMVKQMKKNSVIIDISIDQGWIIETGKPTNHKNPVFTKHGVIHYCVPNIASRV
ncbi:MAG: alanine dehydrogenase [Marinilabiliales bacterium]|nr:MAG: alanine dehydrogenase [Marinilabiliales bacterium]